MKLFYKSCILEIAYKDHDENPGLLQESDFDNIDAEVYKIRPFGTYEVPGRAEVGGIAAIPKDERSLGINMRELNPQGKASYIG